MSIHFWVNFGVTDCPGLNSPNGRIIPRFAGLYLLYMFIWYIEFFFEFLYRALANNGDISPDDHSPESPSSSLELESGSFHKYGVTPPMNLREEKRKKNKLRSHKQKSDKRDIQYHVKNYLLDMANQEQLENVMELDESESSSVRTARNKQRKNSSKTLTNLRGQDRDTKMNSEEVSTSAKGGHTNPLMLMVECPLKVDSSNRFFTSNSRQITASQQLQYAALVKPTLLPRRKQSVTEVRHVRIYCLNHSKNVQHCLQASLHPNLGKSCAA